MIGPLVPFLVATLVSVVWLGAFSLFLALQDGGASGGGSALVQASGGDLVSLVIAGSLPLAVIWLVATGVAVTLAAQTSGRTLRALMAQGRRTSEEAEVLTRTLIMRQEQARRRDALEGLDLPLRDLVSHLGFLLDRLGLVGREEAETLWALTAAGDLWAIPNAFMVGASASGPDFVDLLADRLAQDTMATAALHRFLRRYSQVARMLREVEESTLLEAVLADGPLERAVSVLTEAQGRSQMALGRAPRPDPVSGPVDDLRVAADRQETRADRVAADEGAPIAMPDHSAAPDRAAPDRAAPDRAAPDRDDPGAGDDASAADPTWADLADEPSDSLTLTPIVTEAERESLINRSADPTPDGDRLVEGGTRSTEWDGRRSGSFPPPPPPPPPMTSDPAGLMTDADPIRPRERRSRFQRSFEGGGTLARHLTPPPVSDPPPPESPGLDAQSVAPESGESQSLVPTQGAESPAVSRDRPPSPPGLPRSAPPTSDAPPPPPSSVPPQRVPAGGLGQSEPNRTPAEMARTLPYPPLSPSQRSDIQERVAASLSRSMRSQDRMTNAARSISRRLAAAGLTAGQDGEGPDFDPDSDPREPPSWGEDPDSHEGRPHPDGSEETAEFRDDEAPTLPLSGRSRSAGGEAASSGAVRPRASAFRGPASRGSNPGRDATAGAPFRAAPPDDPPPED